MLMAQACSINNQTISNGIKSHIRKALESSGLFEKPLNQVQYTLDAVSKLTSDKAQEIFKKGAKNNWTLDYTLNQLGGFGNKTGNKSLFTPEQLNSSVKSINLDQLTSDIASQYSFTVEINTAVDRESTWDMRNGPINATYYSDLTVPGGTNYTENEISTPLITPSIKGHAQFSTDNGIGWFRSDDKGIASLSEIDRLIDNYEQIEFWEGRESEYKKYQELLKNRDNHSINNLPTKTRRILELQSDLFQKGRDKKILSFKYEPKTEEERKMYDIAFSDKTNKPVQEKLRQNDFLQLLNKGNNWVTFFVKSIVQDSAKQTITEVQESDVEAKVRELEDSGLLKIKCD